MNNTIRVGAVIDQGDGQWEIVEVQGDHTLVIRPCGTEDDLSDRYIGSADMEEYLVD